MPSDERVPYAFEKRILARLQETPALDPIALWAQALWRGVAPCLGVMAVALVMSFAAKEESAVGSTQTDIADFETAVYAPVQVAMGDSW